MGEKRAHPYIRQDFFLTLIAIPYVTIALTLRIYLRIYCGLKHTR